MPSHLRPRRKGVRSERKTAEDTRQAVTGAKSRSPVTLWAYTYQIVPRQTRSQLRTVRALLDQEHSSAKNASGTFAGRLIVGAQVTRMPNSPGSAWVRKFALNSSASFESTSARRRRAV